MLGTIGRQTGQVRLRLVPDTKQVTLRQHVEQFTGAGTHVYTDEYDSYNTVDRPRSTVAHGHKEWARDDDDDGLREVQHQHHGRHVVGLADVSVPSFAGSASIS